ncbi:MAG: 30S ribosomal protein S17 [Candidatus Taylorbacteria bacterium]|nr:30S ribosomal protein S17 [Candidatus Taylorbacteria bacterium]
MKVKVQKKSRVLKGVVVGVAMKDTAVVKVERFVKHPKYKKYSLRFKKYKVNDPGNTAAVGDAVLISECRPISKEKRFRLVGKSAK